jgi:peptide deformylase
MINLEMKDLSSKTDPLPKMTVENLETAMQGLLPAMAMFMMNPENFKVPPAFLHARQIGAALNCAIFRSKNSEPALLINPKYIVQDESSIKPIVDYNVSYMKSDGTPQAFMSTRSVKILAMYDMYTKGELNEETGFLHPGTFKRDSEILEGDDAIWFQHVCDISEGKLLTRFEKTDVTIDEEDGAELPLGDINEIVAEFDKLDDEVKPPEDIKHD